MNNITIEQFKQEWKPVPFLTNVMQPFYKGLGKILYMSVLILAFIGMFFYCKGYYSEWKLLGKISFYCFCSLLPLWILTTIQIIQNRYRINKICTKLNISVEQFTELETQLKKQ